MICVHSSLCGFRGGFLAPHLAAAAAAWLPPAAKEGQGDCDFSAPHCAHSRPVFRAAARQPHSSRAARDLRGPSLDSPLPLETPPLRYGVGGGGARRSGVALRLVANGWVVALHSAGALRLSLRLPCAAVAGGSHRVAASGGQGGIGGLRVPPTPSLDSLLTPLYRRRSAMGLEAAERCALTRRSAVGARGLEGD